MSTDPCTQSSLGEVDFSHLSLTLEVDFEANVLRGSACWSLTLKTDAHALSLDTRGLEVREVSSLGAPLAFSMGKAHPAFGSSLRIELPESARTAGTSLHILISYATTPASSALGWLPPEQTAGKEYPYVFSQCQAIHARALVPCADAPAAKFTYDATLTVPSWATALMSAVRAGSSRVSDNKTSFSFKQTVPIPSYLLALAVGQLESREIGPRSSVWAEPSVVEAAAYEFAETEKFLAAAEDITGHPYVWGRYDILCMPPSFPYGGMENPCLTFVTPTLLAGDRSLADVVAHEVSHSWTGNLITNATWEHFWLNEGWTVWLERKIKARLKGGSAYFDFSALEGLAHLKDAVDTFGADSPFTHLVPNLAGIDPDDAFSSVPYEKGFSLLTYLTEIVGGHDEFEKFAKAYVARFKRSLITSEEFRTFFTQWCVERQIDSSDVDWQTWFHAPGMPPVVPSYDDSLGKQARELASRWQQELANEDASFKESDMDEWPSPVRAAFLDALLERVSEGTPVPLATLHKMDSLYRLTKMANGEVRSRWQRICLLSRADFIVPHVLGFLKEQGRMKYVRPLYRDLSKWPEKREIAISIFKEWRDNYHPIAAKMLAVDLGL